MEKRQSYELYKLSRANIQLKKTSLESINVVKIREFQQMDYINELGIGRRLEFISDKEIDGFLRTSITIKEKNTKDKYLQIEAVYKGRFEAKDSISREQLEQWTKIQIVPLLLPYARSIISLVTSHMSIGPIVIPTMDILESITSNEDDQSVGE